MKQAAFAEKLSLSNNGALFSNWHTTQQQISSSWKETWRRPVVHVDPGRGRAPQIKFDLGKFYAVFKLL